MIFTCAQRERVSIYGGHHGGHLLPASGRLEDRPAPDAVGAGRFAAGAVAVRHISDGAMRPVLAWTILGMVLFSYVAKYIKNADKLPEHWGFSAFFGMLAGFTTHVANAAGPVMAIYLLSMKLEKKAYIGSAAWYFLILNWIKIPIFAYEGRITASSMRADISMIPLLVVGAALGILLLNKLPQKRFEQIVQALAALGALKVIFLN